MLRAMVFFFFFQAEDGIRDLVRSRGLGDVYKRQAVAVALAAEGYSIAITGRSVQRLKEVSELCTAAGAPACEELPCDLSDSAAVQALAEGMLERHEGCQVLVNNAGVMHYGNPLEGDPADWERMMNVNVNAPMRLCAVLCPKMAERGTGAVINIGSVAGVEPMSGASAAYAASKHAMRGWSISSYLTLRHVGVKCCLISPAFVNTPLLDGVVDETVKRDRMIQPQDIAEYVLFVLRSSPGLSLIHISEPTRPY
eukprot:TRINITY_DN6454_c0_g1_i1.p2 TRINITY_DN6454_c0_g1~~TRINITY_DN6454_c0_g1_i1.p2  ORF type:complete len:254 (-),score=91.43 TRINITY_DN6454_c0_g1_i1:114-875(-)